MEISEELKQLICGLYVPRRFYLTYRRYRKLSNKEKRLFNKYKDQYSPRDWRGAFILMFYLKIPFSPNLLKCISELYNIPHEEFMIKYRTISRRGKPIVIPKFKDKFYKKEFEFQGFIPIEQIKEKKRYFYLESFPFQGQRYVLDKKLEYPKHHHKLNRYNVWDIQSKYGVEGVTRLNFNNI